MQPRLRKGRKRAKRGGPDTKPQGLQIPEELAHKPEQAQTAAGMRV